MSGSFDVSQPHHQPKQPMSKGKKIAIGGGIAAVLLALTQVGKGGDDTRAASTPTFQDSTTTVINTTVVPAGPKTSFGPGIYLVNKQIVPGTYQSQGGSNCYYERRSDSSGDFDGIISNEWSTDHSPQIVTIDPTDVAFKSSGCGPWTKMT